MTKTIHFFSLLMLVLAVSNAHSQSFPAANDVLTSIKKANDYWQKNQPARKRAFWDHAAYHTGNMELYAITKNEAYRKYSEDWAVHNEWKGAKSDDKSDWKYSYGEKDDYVLFGDWQILIFTT
jgi:unsaturated rhamnogalacturonyl hydrolase